MLDLETFRKQIDQIYADKVKDMLGGLDEHTLKKHKTRMLMRHRPEKKRFTKT